MTIEAPCFKATYNQIDRQFISNHIQCASFAGKVMFAIVSTVLPWLIITGVWLAVPLVPIVPWNDASASFMVIFVFKKYAFDTVGEQLLSHSIPVP